MSRQTKQHSQQYWLMKSEPDVFSFNDLKVKKVTSWDGVRNYMARNYMMNEMSIGDLVFFYHSNAKPSGIVGLAEIVGPAKPDLTAFDKKSEYYDPKSTIEKPRWYCVDVGYKQDLPTPVSLEQIKKNQLLKKMALLTHNRLSVQPVSKTEFEEICKMSSLRIPNETKATKNKPAEHKLLKVIL